MEKTFETEVLTRLAVIESKLDGYKEIEKVTHENEAKCKQNAIDIKEMQDKLKWISRTSIGAIIAGIVGIGIALIETGLGVG